MNAPGVEAALVSPLYDIEPVSVRPSVPEPPALPQLKFEGVTAGGVAAGGVAAGGVDAGGVAAGGVAAGGVAAGGVAAGGAVLLGGGALLVLSDLPPSLQPAMIDIIMIAAIPCTDRRPKLVGLAMPDSVEIVELVSSDSDVM